MGQHIKGIWTTQKEGHSDDIIKGFLHWWCPVIFFDIGLNFFALNRTVKFLTSAQETAVYDSVSLSLKPTMDTGSKLFHAHVKQNTPIWTPLCLSLVDGLSFQGSLKQNTHHVPSCVHQIPKCPPNWIPNEGIRQKFIGVQGPHLTWPQHSQLSGRDWERRSESHAKGSSSSVPHDQYLGE